MSTPSKRRLGKPAAAALAVVGLAVAAGLAVTLGPALAAPDGPGRSAAAPTSWSFTRAPAAAEPAGRPGPGNTGVPPGTRLRVVPGDLTIDEDGAVVDGLDVHGFLRIEADDVTVRNTLVRGGDPRGASAALVANYRNRNLTISDSTLRADTASPWVDGLKGQSFTAVRLDVSNVVDTAQVAGDDVVIRDSWFHDTSRFSPWPLQPDDQTHNDNLQIEGGTDILVQGNTFERATNTAIMITQNYDRARGIRVLDNYLADGECTVNIAEKGEGPVRSTFRGNRFGPSGRDNCAIVAAPDSVPDGGDNVWDATGLPVEVRQRG